MVRRTLVSIQIVYSSVLMLLGCRRSKIHSHGGSCFIRLIHGDIVCSGLLFTSYWSNGPPSLIVEVDQSVAWSFYWLVVVQLVFPLIDGYFHCVGFVRAVASVQTYGVSATWIFSVWELHGNVVRFQYVTSIGLKPDSKIQWICKLCTPVITTTTVASDASIAIICCSLMVGSSSITRWKDKVNDSFLHTSSNRGASRMLCFSCSINVVSLYRLRDSSCHNVDFFSQSELGFLHLTA
jgi:hypothetical protein